MKNFAVLSLCILSLSLAACGTKPAAPEEAGHKRAYPSANTDPTPRGGVPMAIPPQ